MADTKTDYVELKNVPDASAGVKGVIQLAGDLGGTSAAPTVVDATPSAKGKVQLAGDLGGTAALPTVVEATPSVKGKIQLAGDLGGTAAAPTVSRVNGVSISGTPTVGQTPVATSGTTATWQTPTGGGSQSLVKAVTSSIQGPVTHSGVSAIPNDNTAPQNTEGVEIISVTITPSSASNRLIIFAKAIIYEITGDYVMLALFQDSGASAIATIHSNEGDQHEIGFIHTMIAGTTSPTTLKIRTGRGTGSSTIILNNGNNAFNLGSTEVTTMVVYEVAA